MNEPSAARERGLIASFSTTDVDLAHEDLRQTYVDHRVRFSGSTTHFRYAASALFLDEVVLGRTDHNVSADLRVDTGLPGPILFQQRGSAHATLTAGREQIEVRDGGTVLIPPGAHCDTRWNACHSVNVKLSAQLLQEDAVAVGAADRPVELGFGLALSAATNGHWTTLTQFVWNVGLTNPHLATSPLLSRELVRLLNTAVLSCFPNSTLADRDQHARSATPDAVRRATAFIDAHVGEPIGLLEIAAAAGLGSRALQAAFRRHLDTTPLSYLREARMDHAHRELLEARPGDGRTVASVASRWGFSQPGRFAREHQRRYGSLPRQLVAASRSTPEPFVS